MIILMFFNCAQRLKAYKIQPSGLGPAPDKHFHSFGTSVAALNTQKGPSAIFLYNISTQQW